MQPHPEEQLAAYVDGELPAADRAEVEAHLESCARCRGEVSLARRGLAAMSLLEEVPVPLGVTGPVLQKVRTERPWLTRAARPFAAVAAAAVIAIGGIAVLQSLGGANDQTAGEEGGPNDERDVPQLEVYEDADFSYADLDTLAAQALGEDAGAKAEDGAAPEESAAGGSDSAPRSSDRATAVSAPVSSLPSSPDALDDPAAALSCIAAAAESKGQDQVLRVISARFGGVPAYIGMYLRSPGAGQDPDRLLVWVVRADPCELLSFASRKI